MKNFFLILAVAWTTGTFAVENLIRNGDMSDEKAVAREVRCTAGSMSVGVEEASWNRYVRLTMGAITRDAKTGEEHANAALKIGTDGKGGEMFPLAGGELYEYALDVRGTAPRAGLSVIVETADGKRATIQAQPNVVKDLTGDWVHKTGTVRIPQGVVRGQFMVLMYWEGKWGKMPYRPGDCVDVDNVRLARRSGRFDEFVARCKKPFVVAPVPVTTDVHLPFVPEELFNAPSNVALTAAGNERKSLPLAIANLTDETEEYRITLEATHPSEKLTTCDGRFGLNGFPSDHVTIWRGVAIKDKDPDMAKMFKANGVRDMPSMKIGRVIDPLVEMGAGSVLTVPPKSVGLVWVDFDTTGVASGDYAGILRVVPLASAVALTSTGSYHDFKLEGDILDLPVKLRVLPFELPREPMVAGNLYCAAENEQMFRLMLELGTREFLLTPWCFTFALDREKGTFGTYRPPSWGLGDKGDARVILNNYRAWAAAAGVKISVFIAYSAYNTFKSLYGIKETDDSPESMKLFGRWIAAVKGLMNASGFSDSDYGIEIWDEPHRQKHYDAVLASLKAAQENAPTTWRIVTFHWNPWTPADFEAVSRYLNGWILYDGKYLGSAWEDYGPVMAKCRARGDSVSHYTCSVKCDEDLDRYYRQNAWQALRHDLTGNALFEATSSRGGMGAVNWKRSPSSDILYRAYDRFLPSVRSMALRQGVEDVKYLKLLGDLGKGDAETQAFIRQAAEIVTQNPAGGDRRLADKVRDKAAKRILKLLGK